MPNKKQNLRNLLLINQIQIEKIVGQLPNSYSVIESLKASLGISIKVAKFEIEASSLQDSSAIKKIGRLDPYLERNGLINRSRPRRMPHAIVNGSQYWWIKETSLRER